MNKRIELTVIESQSMSRESGRLETWKMVISDPLNIKAYMHRGNMLLFNYRGNLYRAFGLSENEFLELCPHLKPQ